jgi:uncharacterized protein YjbI with pentapeptide repeats
VDLDGATFEGCRVGGYSSRDGFVGGKARKARCRGSAWSGQLDDADFSGASLVHAQFRHCKGTKAVFAAADLTGADFTSAVLEGADFAKAVANEADFQGAVLHKASFAGAKLAKARFTGAALRDADLTKADLQDADLTSANLQGAKLDGANLAGACLQGARVDAKQLATAKGIDAKTVDLGSRFGPKLSELDQLAQQAGAVEMELAFRRSDGETKVAVRAFPPHMRASWGIQNEERESREQIDSRSLSTVMVSLAHHFRDAQCQFDSLTVKSTKCAVSGKPLRALALAAWCEALGVPQPDEAALAAQKASRQSDLAGVRERYLNLLRGGPKGIKAWNDLTDLDRAKAAHFREVDLAKANLTDANFRSLDFRKANLAGAKLAKAELTFGDFREANLSGASLQSAKASCTKFNDANLAGANLAKGRLSGASLKQACLTGADLTEVLADDADLCGADLTGAKIKGAVFEGAKYDEATKWPEGFSDLAKLKWAGQGPNPAIVAAQAQQKAAGPIDLPTFLKRLAEAVEKARLDKAVSMLKADRFRLFAEVKADSVTGVVKSQTDAELVYSCRLAADGSFACCTQNLNICGGLRGALCKHLLVLIIGLTKAGELDPTTVDGWVVTSRLQKPVLQKELMSETFLRYKGAEAGEIDWRPTETIPEDYYAM